MVLATVVTTRKRKKEKRRKIPKIVATMIAAAKPPAQQPLGPKIPNSGHYVRLQLNCLQSDHSDQFIVTKTLMRIKWQ